MKKWIRSSLIFLLILLLGIIITGRRMNTLDMENSIPKGSLLWFWKKEIELGDIVLVQNPLDTVNHRMLRVLAKEGQTISFSRDGFIIDGKRLHLSYMGEIDSQFQRWKESYYDANGTEISWLIQRPNQASSWTMEPQTIPPGHVFLVCDNRSSCLDSRWWGAVEQNAITSSLLLQISIPDPWHPLLFIQ